MQLWWHLADTEAVTFQINSWYVLFYFISIVRTRTPHVCISEKVHILKNHANIGQVNIIFGDATHSDSTVTSLCFSFFQAKVLCEDSHSIRSALDTLCNILCNSAMHFRKLYTGDASRFHSKPFELKSAEHLGICLHAHHWFSHVVWGPRQTSMFTSRT